MNLALPGMLQKLLEFVEPLPKPFDPAKMRAVAPDPAKERTLAGHIRECHARYVELRIEQQNAVIERARDRRLLWILIALAVGGNLETLKAVAAFVAN